MVNGFYIVVGTLQTFFIVVGTLYVLSLEQ